MSRLQSKCSLWFEYRKGRLTTSNFHEIVHTNCEQLSRPSLLKKIMQYNPAIDTCATRWGIKHEEDALKMYKNEMMEQHSHFELQSSGLIIYEDYPFLAASPDAVITCDCCGKGDEVKCPNSRRDNVLDKLCPHSLKPSHKYFTQIQGQMALTKLDYCDFVCWTSCGLHIERVRADSDFLLNMEQALRLYFINIVLPELLTQKEHDDMIACDNKGCPTEWYHVQCVGLKLVPKGKWVCFKCKNSKTTKRKKKS
ncbi:hypothetical protein ACJMK2_032304 [Sinanodonta woodiana]|uniref:Zinc finger PHD-type domain-containing protein n=1 Tax=Sinanodonta woodiana TaxID=1069815 RepID=A0ABD3X1W3_SINWO